MQLPAYVKVGITGYGPDLDESDEPFDDVAALCSAIVWEINDTIGRLADEWSMLKAIGDAEGYMAARELADSLEILAANLNYERRAQAPLYRTNRAKLDGTMLGIVDATFPLDVDVDGNHRLYVWTAE